MCTVVHIVHPRANASKKDLRKATPYLTRCMGISWEEFTLNPSLKDKKVN